MGEGMQEDLIVLVADKNTEQAICGMFSRPQSLGLRPIVHQTAVHINSDPGCLREGVGFLRPFCRSFRHALVMFDREGCGKDALSREELEQQVEDALAKSGWGGRSAAVVIDPELEAWVWSDSPHVEDVLGWSGRKPNLRTWLRAQSFLDDDNQIKPVRPKEAVEAALRVSRTPRSSSLYLKLAQRVSLTICTDPAFLKLQSVLQDWFRPEPSR